MEREPYLDPSDADRIFDGGFTEGEYGRVAELLADERATFAVAPTPKVKQQHLAAMAEAFLEAPAGHLVTTPIRRSLMNRVLATRAAKAFAIGLAALLATGSALAATGSLPDRAQDAVADTIDVVGLDIPGGVDEQVESSDDDDGAVEDDDGEAEPNDDGEAADAGEHGPARSTDGCPEGFTGNHGEFVSRTDETPRNEAAQSNCGKPERAVEDGDDGAAPEDEAPDQQGGDDQGSGGENRGRGGEHGKQKPGDDERGEQPEGS